MKKVSPCAPPPSTIFWKESPNKRKKPKGQDKALLLVRERKNIQTCSGTNKKGSGN